MNSNFENAGFAAPIERALVKERRGLVLAELFAIGGLVVSTLIAATAMGVFRWAQGYRPAKLYTLAWTFTLVSLII